MTSNEIEPYQPRAEVDSWSAVMPSVVKLAEYVQDTEFIPKTLRNRPAAIAAAILSGREMGIGPMRALSHVHMIDGRPSLSAEQKRAAALAAGHEIAYVESTTTQCTVKGRRKGSDQWSTVTWTADDAKTAGLAGRENWRKHPRRMLQARATGELVDLLFPDASAGLATTEELLDGTDVAGITTDGQEAPRKRTARRQTTVHAKAERVDEIPEPRPAPSQGPPLPGEEGYDETAGDDPKHRPASAEAVGGGEEPSTPNRGVDGRNKVTPGRDAHATPGPDSPPPPAGITSLQRGKMLALFNGIGIRDREERLHISRVIVNRDQLSSANELTKDEASALIDTLERVGAEDDPKAALRLLLAEAEAHQEAFDTGATETAE